MVSACANGTPPDWTRGLQGGTMGNLSTILMMKQPLREAQFAIGLYTDYFGPLPFKRLAMTQQDRLQLRAVLAGTRLATDLLLL